MTKTQRASEQIIEEVTSWPGVEAGPGVSGEFSFKLGRREIGPGPAYHLRRSDRCRR